MTDQPKPCARCHGPIENDRHTPCCSSAHPHGRDLCCLCYSRTHFVDTGCCGPQFARSAS